MTVNESTSLAPTLLVAMPQLQDPNFSRSVVLLCEHRGDGAMGLVVNRPSNRLASEIVAFEPPLDTGSCLEVWLGGPVDPTRGWLLLGTPTGEGIEIVPGVYLSASIDLLRKVVETSDLVAHCRFLIGYAGWGPGQLDEELLASAWLTVPADRDFLFETPSEDMWELAIRRLGIEPAALALGPGVH